MREAEPAAGHLAEQPIVEDVWREKYRYRDERSYADTCARVIGALCKNETREFTERALRAMRAREIVPAGRILAGAGTDKRVTLINCFTSPLIQDSMRTEPALPGLGIMDALSVASFTQQMGGGIGMDFSTIRPRGALVKRTQSVSSGVLPFMDMWDAMCATIRSSGARRGAMMATLRCDHPDLEEFIAAKQQPGRLTNFNISILVTDAFMQAVEKDAGWHLVFDVPPAEGVPSAPRSADCGQFIHAASGTMGHVYKTLRARELWEKITAATYIHAEPGVVFIDRVNQQNNLVYCETIHCCNPCGEQMLPDNGDCNLGHTNLAVMVDRPFEPDAVFNFAKLERSAEIMVRLLDNVLDLTQWPTPEQAEEARLKRRIGLGFTGLASALQQLDIAYGSAEAVKFTREVARRQARAAYIASYEVAKERGSFPLYDADKFCASPFVQRLDQGAPKNFRVVDGIRQYGIRNGVLLSIAPTGTTSLAVGNVSSGIEPVFAHRYTRRVRGNDGEMDREYSIYDYGYLRYCARAGLDPDSELTLGGLSAGFITADRLTVEQHLQMAAAAQEWVDSAVSKTINCPASMTIEEFRGVYARAYALGMKGCTTYRPDPRSGRGSVLEIADPIGEKTGQHGASEVGAGGDPALRGVGSPTLSKIPMQEVVEGRRYRIKWPSEDCSYYVMITDYADAMGRRRPFELFISTKSERHSEWIKAFSLLVTAIFRREDDPSFVVEELQSVFAATGGSWIKVPWQDKPKLAASLVAAIGLKIEEHLRWLGMMGMKEAILQTQPVAPLPARGAGAPVFQGPLGARPHLSEEVMPAAELLDVCDQCGARAVVYSEGCATCHACGRSDCG